MFYTTIVLELIQEQYPALHEQLRSTRTLLSTLHLHAAALRRYHEDRMDRIAQSNPDRDPSQLASQALELALEDLREDLSSASPPTGGAAEAFSLDAAMGYIRRATPSA